MTISARPSVPVASHAKSLTPCPLRIDVLADSRSDPRILGNVQQRVVYAPQDTSLWLRNMLSGMRASGVQVAFAADAAANPDGLAADVTLRTAWISQQVDSTNANVVLHIQLRRDSVVISESDYRGAQNGVTWSQSDKSLQQTMDLAFGRAVEQFAATVRAACARRA